MSQEYHQLLKGLKKSEIIDIISNLESKHVALPDEYKSPSSSLKKESLIDVAISIIKANESTENWNDVLKETPYLDALVVSEEEVSDEEKKEIEEELEEENEEEEDAEDDDECASCDDNCCFSYEPTLKEKVQWKIYDFKWEMLLLNESVKSFCTSVNGLFKISVTVELLTLFLFVSKFQNSLTFCPYLVEKIGNKNILLALKCLEILAGYIVVFIAAPLVVSYYFNFLPEPVEEGDEEHSDDEEDEELYASDSEDEAYDSMVAPEEEEEEEEEDVSEIEEKDATEEGEDVNELLLNQDEDSYDYDDLDSDYLSDAEDDYDYEEYPSLTLVDEDEKDSFDPFTYSLTKIAVAYICYRYGTGVCEFNDLVVNSNLYEVSIGLGVVGALIGLYN